MISGGANPPLRLEGSVERLTREVAVTYRVAVFNEMLQQGRELQQAYATPEEAEARAQSETVRSRPFYVAYVRTASENLSQWREGRRVA